MTTEAIQIQAVAALVDFATATGLVLVDGKKAAELFARVEAALADPAVREAAEAMMRAVRP